MYVNTNVTDAEAISREFAEAFPTPNTLRMLTLCETGKLTWEQMERIATSALRAGLAAVNA